MARITSADYEKTKLRLLEVGLSFFEKKGYNATGIQEIATQAEVSKGSFYTYFSSKEDFGVGVIRYYTQNNLINWKKMLEEATEQEDAYAALGIAFASVAAQYKTAETKKGCLLGTLAAEISEASQECRLELQKSINQYIEILAERLLIGQELGKVRKDLPSLRLAELIWDCWQGSLLRMKIEHNVEPVNRDLELMFNGLLVCAQ